MAVRLKVFKIYSGFVDDMKGVFSCIEISIRPGIPTFDVLGLCDSSIKECRGRVKAAIISSGFVMPGGHVTVNISPAYIRKSGTCCDLPIALGLLFVSSQIKLPPDAKIYAEGELSLTGDLRPTPGCAMRLMNIAGKEGDRLTHILLPKGSETPACCAGIRAMCVGSLKEAAEVFSEGTYAPELFSPVFLKETFPDLPDLSCVKGQDKAKRAILIAAAGRHNLILLGSPGCGKTMAARLAAGIMPPMTSKEKSEVYAVNEVSALGEDLVRPFRYIHPGITPGRLIGSSRFKSPGECVLANNGILFADEICEYSPQILDLLRIPLEERRVFIRGDEDRSGIPASFVFIGAGNPCKCGNYFEKGNKCRCSPAVRKKYLGKLSGPFIDRIDLFSEMRSISEEDLGKIASGEMSDEGKRLRELTEKARRMQSDRYGEGGFNGTADGAGECILRAPKAVVDMAVKVASSDG